MKGLILPATVALAAVAPAAAGAKTPTLPGGAKAPTPAHARTYERVYDQVAREFGHRVPGRNIIKYGFAPNQPATDAETVASIGVLERMLVPTPASGPAVRPATTVSSPASDTSSATTGSGAGGVPACASESGTNYATGASNTNASSGATRSRRRRPPTTAATCPRRQARTPARRPSTSTRALAPGSAAEADRLDHICPRVVAGATRGQREERGRRVVRDRSPGGGRHREPVAQARVHLRMVEEREVMRGAEVHPVLGLKRDSARTTPPRGTRLKHEHIADQTA